MADYHIAAGTRILAIRENTEWYIDHFTKAYTKNINVFGDVELVFWTNESYRFTPDKWLEVQFMDFISGGGSLQNLVIFKARGFYVLVEEGNVTRLED